MKPQQKAALVIRDCISSQSIRAIQKALSAVYQQMDDEIAKAASIKARQYGDLADVIAILADIRATAKSINLAQDAILAAIRNLKGEH